MLYGQFRLFVVASNNHNMQSSPITCQNKLNLFHVKSLTIKY